MSFEKKEQAVTASFDPGVEGNSIVVILQNPGKKEEQAHHPAAGKTGQNLHFLLAKLKDVNQKILCVPQNDFVYSETEPQKGVMVVNACEEEGDSRSLPTSFDCGHVRFVAKQIKDKRLVLCFGKVAASFYDLIKGAQCANRMNESQIVLKCCHLGMKALNRKIPNTVLDEQRFFGKNATEKRIDIVAQYLISQLGNREKEKLSFECYLKCLNVVDL